MDSVSNLLTQLGFHKTFDVRNKSDISDLLRTQIPWGIYVLHFEDGDYYIGQSIDIEQRFRQHRHYWTIPIVSISFKTVNPYDLSPEETLAIEAFKALRKSLPKGQQFRIKNIKGNEYQLGEAEFDFVMPPDKQDEWIKNVAQIDLHGKRSEFPDLRAQYKDKFQHKFMRQPFAHDTLEVLRQYIRGTIPEILQTEGVFWAASCVPQSHVYSRINVNWQEVLAVWGRDILEFSFHTAFESTGLPEGVMRMFQAFGAITIDAENVYTIESPIAHTDEDITEQMYEDYGFTSPYRQRLVHDLEKYFERFPTLQISGHIWKPGGEDQVQLVVYGKKDALALIGDTEFRRSMRIMNLRLMRFGPCRWAANHCMDLADHCLS